MSGGCYICRGPDDKDAPQEGCARCDQEASLHQALEEAAYYREALRSISEMDLRILDDTDTSGLEDATAEFLRGLARDALSEGHGGVPWEGVVEARLQITAARLAEKPKEDER